MNITDNLPDGIKNNLPIKEAYSDALSPAMKQIGGILESGIKAARFILAPIDYIAAYQDRFQRLLKRISEKVPEEKLIEGHPQIVVPIVDGFIKSYDGTLLSEMFLNLLSNAINVDNQNLAHPAFPVIINQLSHDEAVILFHLKKSDYLFKEKFIYDMTHSVFIGKTVIWDEFPTVNLNFPNQFHANVFHLEGLSLIGSTQVSHDREDDITGSTSIQNSSRTLTQFGKLFAEACIPDEYEHIS